jgi:hypothetical protein
MDKNKTDIFKKAIDAEIQDNATTTSGVKETKGEVAVKNQQTGKENVAGEQNAGMDKKSPVGKTSQKGLALTDKEMAKKLAVRLGVKIVYKAGKWWFVNKKDAQRTGEKVIIFEVD